MAVEPKIIPVSKSVGGGKPISQRRNRRTREQKGQAARRVSMRLQHKHYGERQQIAASQKVQTARAINALRVQRQQQISRTRTTSTSQREVANSAVNQPVGPQVSQGTGSVGGAVLRIFITIILFSVLYLVLVNANTTSGLIHQVGIGLTGLSSDKTLFVKKTA